MRSPVAVAARAWWSPVVVVAELLALDLDALAAVVTIEHVAPPSSTSMRSPAAVVADLVVAGVAVVAELAALDVGQVAQAHDTPRHTTRGGRCPGS